MKNMQQNIEINEDKKETILEGLGFTEHTNKKGLYQKTTNEQIMNWDFRKNPKGRFYVSEIGGGFIPAPQAKQLEEYIVLRQQIKNGDNGNNTPKMDTITRIQTNNGGNGQKTNELMELRGTEKDIMNVVQKRNLDLIIKASGNQKKPGEGILYYDKKIGGFQLIEPSVELVDIISAQMGNITVEIVEKGTRNHTDMNTGETYQTYYCVVKAKDTLSGSEGLGSAEEIIDYKEMAKTGRTFALTKAIRKAERNAKERLIPVPRKAMVELVKEILENHQKNNGGKK
jgi:hypothetical protein